MTKTLSQLIAEARAKRAANAMTTTTRHDGKVMLRGESATGYVKQGDIEVRVIPVQPRGLSSRWSHRADVYIGGKRIKTSDLKAMLATETA